MKKLFTLTILSFLTFTQANAAFLNPNQPTSGCCGLEGNFSVGADWLYWKGEQTGLVYGAEVDLNTPEVDTIDVQSKILRPEFKYSSGFRINADYLTPQQNWRFSGSFTHMPIHASNDVNLLGMNSFDFATLFNVQFPLFGVLSTSMFTELHSDWSADFNYLDLTVARTFNVCRRLEISPYIGLRGLWICQTLRFDGIGTSAEGAPLTFDSTLRGRLGAGGLQGGFKSSLDLTNGLSIVGMFGGSLLYGWSKDNGDLEVIIDEGLNTLGYRDNPTKSLPSIDAFIGLEYISCLMNIGFDIHVGWEQHVIYETNEFSFVGAGTSTTLQGLTLGANVHF